MNRNDSTLKKADLSLGERYLAEGINVSNDTRFTGMNNNDMIIGGTGSGKTGSYVSANLVYPCGSMVVSDTKGRLHKMYGKHLRELGYKVHVIDFINPGHSGGYNPLQFIRRTKDGRYYERDIRTLANALCPVQNERDPYWEQAGGRHISMLISYVLEALPVSDHTLLKVCELHRAYLERSGRFLLQEWAEEHPDSLAAKKYLEMGMLRSAEKTYVGVMEMASNALDIYEYAEFAPIFEKSRSFDFRRLGREKSILFLITSDNDSAFDRMTNILHTQILQTLIDEADHQRDGMLPEPCRIILDDFAASARIPDFARTISIIRSRNISVSVILQSKTQLDGMYGQCDSASIIANCDHILFLGGSDLDTAHFISTHLDRTSKTVLTLDREEAVLIVRGTDAKIVRKIPPYSIRVEDAVSESVGKEADYDKA